MKPDWAEAHSFLGQAYEDLGQNEEFLVALKEADRLKPNDVAILVELGHAFRANRKYSEAIDPLRRVVNARPDDVDAMYLLGNTLLMAGKYDQAIKTLSQVLVSRPDHSEARERLRVASARKDLLPKLEQFRQRVAQEPNSGGAYAQLGQGYNSLGMYAEAEQAYLKAIELEPRNYEFHTRLCVDYSEWGKDDKAVVLPQSDQVEVSPCSI